MIHYCTDPKDYTSTETDLTFTPDNSRICVNIPITNDTIVEENKNFTVTVTSNDPSVQIGPNSNSAATIIDDDGKWHYSLRYIVLVSILKRLVMGIVVEPLRIEVVQV